MAKKLTIAFPTSSFLPGLGGVEVGLHNIALRMQQRCHRPIVMVTAPHYAALQTGWSLPYEVISFPPKVWGLVRHVPPLGLTILDAWFEWARRRYSIDVWHCTMGWPTGVALVHYARRWRAIPHLVRCAGEDIQREPAIGYGVRLDPKVDALVRQWLTQADCLVATTDTVAAEYKAIGVEDARIARIPNGVDVARLRNVTDRAATRAKLGVSDSDTVFLAVGRNHTKKDFVSLLRAAAELKKRGYTAIRVVIAGLGTTPLRPEADKLGLGSSCVLIEQIGNASAANLALPPDELVRLYQAADVFVLPSITETFGIVLVEAMAAGLPIITTDAPGCRDIIRRGQDGIMVPPSQPALLANAMERVMRNPALAAGLKTKSFARAGDFSWDDIAARYEAAYFRLISQGPAGVAVR